MMSASSRTRAAGFSVVASEEDLAELVRVSAHGPLFLFLDDPYCPISNFAAAQVMESSVAVARIDVAAKSELGRAVARVTGIKHASPQLILFRGGRAVWSASHGKITSRAILAALARLTVNELSCAARVAACNRAPWPRATRPPHAGRLRGVHSNLRIGDGGGEPEGCAVHDGRQLATLQRPGGGAAQHTPLAAALRIREAAVHRLEG